jgi:hypothetical protein
VRLLDKKRGDEPASARDVQCPFIQPEIGITSTPVIDLKTGTLYVLARTKISHTFNDREYFQHLDALAITTGGGKVRRSQADYRIRPRKRRWFFRWASAF